MAKKRNVNSSKEELNLLAEDVITSIRDGPFDIQGGGWDFSSRQFILFSLLAQ